MPLIPITSELLKSRHGFFDRTGGVSSGIYANLNCAFGSSDQTDSVRHNRALIASHLGVETTALLGVHQIHSADAVCVDAPLATDAPPQSLPKADGLATATNGLALGILTADCLPVLFEDPVSKVIGAAHAGWRGTFGGVLEKMLAVMETLGASRSSIRVAIGPCISQPNYEVGEDFYKEFLASSPDNSRFFLAGHSNRFLFDLPQYALSRLQAAGIGQCHWTGHCTYSNVKRFYSYRRDVTHCGAPDYGRMMAAIRL